MRIITCGLLLVAVTFGLVAAAQAPAVEQPAATIPTLTLAEAKRTARYTGRIVAMPFTERQPTIRVRCRLTGRLTARCKVRVRGQRIAVRFNTSHRKTSADYVLVYAGSLALL